MLRSASAGAGLPLALTTNATATPAVALTGPGLAPKTGAETAAAPVGIFSAGSPSKFRPNWIQRSEPSLPHRLTMSALCMAKARPSVRPLVSYIRL